MNKKKYIKLFEDITISANYLHLLHKNRLKDSINKYPDSYFANIYSRLIINIKSSVILLEKSIEDNKHIGSIMLIVRSGILDCLHLFYLASFIKEEITDLENQKDLIEEIKKINCNQVNYMIEDLKFTQELSEIKESHLKYIKENCSECFEKMIDINLNYELKKNYKKTISSKTLVNQSKYKEASIFLYSQYAIFSKYDHNGEFSMPIVNLATKNYEKELIRILMCLGYFFEGIMNCSLFIFFNKNTQIEKVFLKCRDTQNIMRKNILEFETYSK